VLHRIAFLVVSEWYQKVTANTFEVAIPNECSFYTLGVFRVRGDASSLDPYHVLPRRDEWRYKEGPGRLHPGPLDAVR
jgi:hypothetical protein